MASDETPQATLSTGPAGAGRPPALDEDQLDVVVRLKAQGISDRQIALAHGVSGHTIARHLKSPQAQEKLAYWREIVRAAILQGIAEGGVTQALKVLKKASEDEDAKGVDAGARALMNLEKTAASAAGEAKKVDMTVGGSGQPVDVRALIASFVEHHGA